MTEKHSTILKQEETLQMKKLNDKEKSLDVLKIDLEKALQKKNVDYELASLQNEITLKKEIGELENWEKSEEIRIDGIIAKLNDYTLKKMRKESELNNAVFYIGDSIPKFMNGGSQGEVNGGEAVVIGDMA